MMANQGYLYAYAVREDDGIGDFYNIEVNVINGDLVLVN
jgi:hypothetical protein